MNYFFKSLAPVWVNPKHVKIDQGAIEALAQKIAEEDFPTPSWREEVFPKEDDTDFVQFIGIANAINFCFIDFSTGNKFDAEYPERSGKIWRGSYGMAACLKRAIDEGMPLLEARFLAALEEKHVQHIFRPATTPIPFLKERLTNLQNVGKRLLFARRENFLQMFEESEYRLFNNGRGIAERLHQDFESYKDSLLWREKYLVFAKRAQLFPMTYHGRALDSHGKLKTIEDPECFGPILDYVVPNALRIRGVLHYSPMLERKVRIGIFIPEGSEEEIEIRALTAQAVVLLLGEINRRRNTAKHITMPALDSYLWRNGRQQGTFLHHKTSTMAY